MCDNHLFYFFIFNASEHRLSFSFSLSISCGISFHRGQSLWVCMDCPLFSLCYSSMQAECQRESRQGLQERSWQRDIRHVRVWVICRVDAPLSAVLHGPWSGETSGSCAPPPPPILQQHSSCGLLAAFCPTQLGLCRYADLICLFMWHFSTKPPLCLLQENDLVAAKPFHRKPGKYI